MRRWRPRATWSGEASDLPAVPRGFSDRDNPKEVRGRVDLERSKIEIFKVTFSLLFLRKMDAQHPAT